MAGRPIQTEAFVLTRQPPADRFQQLTVFSPRYGDLRCLRRLATKSAPSTAILDLFDKTDLWLETSNEGRTWFIREARVLAHHEAIGRSYETLRLACAFAGTIARNSVHEESREGVFRLLQQTFEAFGSCTRPDLVYLKALYCFARDEGYPVKQEWWQGLPAALRASAADMLNKPVKDQCAAPTAVGSLIQRLEDYLRLRTEILME
jgi:recombinational DNA repair protein (RecF pathway)